MITPRKLETALSQGLPPSEIAKAHKIPVISVYRLANRYGIELDGGPKQLKDLLAERYEEGLSYLQAAEELECSETYAKLVFDTWIRRGYRQKADHGDLVEAIRKMIAKGKNPSDCAKKFTISTDNVKHIMRENGIEWQSKRGKFRRKNAGKAKLIQLYHKGVSREDAVGITGLSPGYVAEVYWRENKKARQ